MSDEPKLGEASTESDLGYSRMSDHYAAPELEVTTYEGPDTEAAKLAADDLLKRRREEPEPTERKYVEIGGENDGKPIPENQSVSLTRASDDLARQRGFEAERATQAAMERDAAVVDAIREQPQQPTEQPQPETQQQPQPETPPGVDVELAALIEQNPKLRSALEATAQEIQQRYNQVEAAKQHYTTEITNAAALAFSGVLASFPELANVNVADGAQLRAALAVMNTQSPERAQQAVQQLERADKLFRDAQSAQRAQAEAVQAQQSAQLQAWVQNQSAQFDRLIANEPPETVRNVRENVLKVASEAYGISENEFKHLYQTQPLFRSAAFGKMMYDATKYHLAQQNIREARQQPVPPVARPGVARAHGDDSGTTHAAAQAFRQSPTIESAAALIKARRSR